MVFRLERLRQLLALRPLSSDDPVEGLAHGRRSFGAARTARFVLCAGELSAGPKTAPDKESLPAPSKQWLFFLALKNSMAVDSEFDLRIPIAVE
jgi:hypothetical protein